MLAPVFIRISGALLVLLWIMLIVVSFRWPLVGDAPLFHYIVFLMHRGMIPYREIKDLNLPGTYAAEATVMRLFGTGALAWRLWDLTLTFCIAGSIYSISRTCTRISRFAPIFAATLFALIHARDGIIQLGQRDLLLTTLYSVPTLSFSKPRETFVNTPTLSSYSSAHASGLPLRSSRSRFSSCPLCSDG